MITAKEAAQVHRLLIENFGGSHGIRDEGALAAALARPFQTFDGKELYTTTIQKAASVIESILLNHPFVDGNKKTGYVLMRLLLLENGMDIYASQNEKYRFVMQIASGKTNFEGIVNWLEQHTIEGINP